MYKLIKKFLHSDVDEVFKSFYDIKIDKDWNKDKEA